MTISPERLANIKKVMAKDKPPCPLCEDLGMCYEECEVCEGSGIDAETGCQCRGCEGVTFTSSEACPMCSGKEL